MLLGHRRRLVLLRRRLVRGLRLRLGLLPARSPRIPRALRLPGLLRMLRLLLVLRLLLGLLRLPGL
ncbi:hypothetical protein AB0J52_25325 [Spirillospora sp. NPDC049652]